MSNELVRKRQVEPTSKLATVEAALQRLETAVSDAAGRLRAELAEMLEVIGNLRQAVLTDSDPAVLLIDLEARTARLLADLEGLTPGEPSRQVARPAGEQAFLDAMTDGPAVTNVPTVSAVVARLGLGEEPNGERPNAVAKLEAMVEQLAATMRAAPATVEAATQVTPGETAPGAWIESASPPDEPPPADEPHEPIAITELAPEVLEFILQAKSATWPDPVATADLPPEAEAAPVAAEPAPPARPSPMPDIDLLDNFVRTTRPFIPPEIGKAVIFAPRAETPAEIRPAQATAPEPPPESAPNAVPLAESPGPPLAKAVLVMPPAEPEPPLSEPPADLKTGETDLDAMLFEPEPEGDPDPAAMLLDNAPEAEPDPAASLFKPADPLAPLRAMSDEERIALFE